MSTFRDHIGYVKADEITVDDIIRLIEVHEGALYNQDSKINFLPEMKSLPIWDTIFNIHST